MAGGKTESAKAEQKESLNAPSGAQDISEQPEDEEANIPVIPLQPQEEEVKQDEPPKDQPEDHARIDDERSDLSDIDSDDESEGAGTATSIRSDIDRDGDERGSVLERKLVDDYYDDAPASDDEEDAVGNRTRSSAAGSRMKEAEKIGKYLGTGATVLSAATNTALLGVGYGAMAFNGDTAGKISKETLEGDTGKTVSSGVSLLTNVAGMGSAGIKSAASLYKAKKSKSRYNRKTARLKAAAGITGFLEKSAGAVSSGLGLFGGGSSGAKDASSGLGVAGGLLGLTSSILDYAGNKADTAGHRQVASDTADYADANRDSADAALTSSGGTLKRLKSIRKTRDLTDPEKLELAEARTARHTAKAQRFAMMQASKLHQRRADQGSRGWLSMIGSGLGLLGSSLKGAASVFGGASGILKTLGSVTGAVSGMVKTAGIIKGEHDDQVNAGKYKISKHEVVDEYLTEKAKKIRKQAKEMQLDRRESDSLGDEGKTLSDSEAKIIAIKRLAKKTGVSDPAFRKLTFRQSDDAVIPDELYEAIFKILVKKRAKNIMNAEPGKKTEMLDTLGLDHNAGIEDIESALSP